LIETQGLHLDSKEIAMKISLLSLVAMLAMFSSRAHAEEISAWFAPSATKILRDAQVGQSPLSWDLAASRNETEACQLVLASEKAVSNVAVSVSALESEGGQGRLQAELFKVEYVPIKKEKIPYPDPLPPLVGSIELAPGQAQPVWISVRVPKAAAPGVYRGTVSVKAGEWSRELPLVVKVWDFALPDTPSSVTAFGNGPEMVAERHGVQPGSPKALALAKKYYEFLLERRVSPIFIPVDLTSKEAESYLNDPRMTSYLIPYKPDDAEMKALTERLLAGGWFSKGYFYVVDEPQYRIVAPFYANPNFGNNLKAADLMLGRLNVWCPHLDYLATEPNFEKLPHPGSAISNTTFAPNASPEPGFGEFLHCRKNAGESIWWYVCNNPREPYNNLQIDQNGMAHRTLLWQQKRQGLQGLLYWHTTYWPKNLIDDPWQNMDTLGTGYYGDGSLLYPGNKVGIDGPISSIRLEVLRDSLEDFDYLTLAERRLGEAAVKGYIARIARSLTDYERDPSRLEEVRRELAAAIEKANVASQKL
jgi:hypothetical protein